MKTLALLLLSGSLAFGQAFTFADPCFVASLNPSGGSSSTNPQVLFHFDESGGYGPFIETVSGQTLSWSYGTSNAVGVAARITNGIITKDAAFHGEFNSGVLFEDFTLSCWLKYTNSLSGNRTLLSTGWGNPAYPGVLSAFVVWVASGTMYVESGGEGGGVSGTFGPVTVSANWKHYAACYSKTTGDVSFYVNGVLDSTSSLSGGAGTPFQGATTWNQISIGCTDDGTVSQMFSNGIDDLALFNSCLSSNRIAEIYSNGTNGIPIIP